MAATGSSCKLKFQSTVNDNGGVVPSYARVVPLGHGTTDPYPNDPISEGCAPPPGPPFIPKGGAGQRCQEAGTLVPDSVWANYPSGASRTVLAPGVPSV